MEKRRYDKGAFPERKDFFPWEVVLWFLLRRNESKPAPGFPICSHHGWMNLFRGQVLLLLNSVNTMCLSLEAPLSIGFSGAFVSVNGPFADVRHLGLDCSVKHLFPFQTHSLPSHSHPVPQVKR
jgi:hypothetical protein